MGTTERTAFAKFCAIALNFSAVLAAHAAPPANHETVQPPAVRLDLRAPLKFSSEGPAMHGLADFPTSRQRDLNVGRASPVAEFVNPKSQPMSRIQALADRFHREGMPVARLWENRSALVSLGLNQRGKFGVWLIQKTR